MKINVIDLLKKYPTDLLSVLRELGGYYECPKDKNCKRLGPLVGYAGRDKETGLQYVGEIYVDCSKLEQYPVTLQHFAEDFFHNEVLSKVTTFSGTPLGGMAYGTILALQFRARYIFLEKKVLELATTDNREISELVFGRHKVEEGEEVAIVEDVCNNFSTTDQMIDMIITAGGKVSAILCILNRSMKYDEYYYSEEHDLHIPIISLVRQPIMEYQQSDKFVSADIAAGNFVPKPKDEWPRLVQIMVDAEKE